METFRPAIISALLVPSVIWKSLCFFHALAAAVNPNVRQFPIKSYANLPEADKEHKKFFIVFLCELCAFARDLFGSGFARLGIVRSRFSCKPDCVPAAFSGFAGWYGYGFRLESALLQATGECLVCFGRPDGQKPSVAESGKGRF